MIWVSHLVAMNYEYSVIYVSLDDVRAMAAAVVSVVAVVTATAADSDRINQLAVFHSRPMIAVGFLVLVDLAVVIDCKPLTQYIYTHIHKNSKIALAFSTFFSSFFFVCCRFNISLFNFVLRRTELFIFAFFSWAILFVNFFSLTLNFIKSLYSLFCYSSSFSTIYSVTAIHMLKLFAFRRV